MNEKMHRWSADHPLSVHVNVGELNKILLLTTMRPPSTKSSVGIDVKIEQYVDNTWALIFELTDERYRSAFYAFYEDLYDSTYDISQNQAAVAFINIYNKWKDAFSVKKNPLSREEIQGLIGELICMRDLFLEDHPPEQILNAWMINEQGKQDFIFERGWVEVKTTIAGSNHVMISSVEQLDDGNLGRLIVVRLKKVGLDCATGVTVNSLIQDLELYFEKYGLGSVFLSRLRDYDLPSKIYDQYRYEVKSIKQYEVNGDFLCIRRNQIPKSVGCITYELYLDQLSQFELRI